MAKKEELFKKRDEEYAVLLDRFLKYKEEEAERINSQNSLYESWVNDQKRQKNETKMEAMAQSLAEEFETIAKSPVMEV